MPIPCAQIGLVTCRQKHFSNLVSNAHQLVAIYFYSYTMVLMIAGMTGQDIMPQSTLQAFDTAQEPSIPCHLSALHLKESGAGVDLPCMYRCTCLFLHLLSQYA